MKIPKRDPEEDKFVDMLLCMNYMEKCGKLASRLSICGSKRMNNGFDQTQTTWPPSKYDQLGPRRKLLSEFILKRQKEKEESRELKKQRRKEMEELLALKKQRQQDKEELRELKREKRELKKQRKEVKKMIKKKKELKKMKREKRKMKREKKKTALTDPDEEAPSKKLKLVQAEDGLAHGKEMLNLEVVGPSEDVEQQKQCVSLFET